MDEREELRRLREVVREAAHDLANALGIALNYTAFLREDLDGGDPAGPGGSDNPARAALEPIESALGRAAESVARLRAEVSPAAPARPAAVSAAGSAEEQIGPDRAQDRQHD